MWSAQSKCPDAEPSENNVASNPKDVAFIPGGRSVMTLVPPPLILPTTVAALAAPGWMASIAKASEIAAIKVTSFRMISFVTSQCAAESRAVASLGHDESVIRGEKCAEPVRDSSVGDLFLEPCDRLIRRLRRGLPELVPRSRRPQVAHHRFASPRLPV